MSKPRGTELFSAILDTEKFSEEWTQAVRNLLTYIKELEDELERLRNS